MLVVPWPLAVTTATPPRSTVTSAMSGLPMTRDRGSVGNLQDAGLIHRHEDRLNRARRRRGSEEEENRREEAQRGRSCTGSCARRHRNTPKRYADQNDATRAASPVPIASKLVNELQTQRTANAMSCGRGRQAATPAQRRRRPRQTGAPYPERYCVNGRSSCAPKLVGNSRSAMPYRSGFSPAGM